MPKQPLAEVFGFPIDNMTPEAQQHREKRLCPFNNRVPNCTKDKVSDPLGVCSVFDGDVITITCPVRFRQNWRIVDDAAAFFFPKDTKWTTLTEVRLNDAHGKSAGNIDVVLVSYDDQGNIRDFGALEIQAVYISGTIRGAFAYYMADPPNRSHMDWSSHANYPRPDYLSSSRKRLAPQLIFKGGILHAWQKKQAVAVDSHFFATLPHLDEVPSDEAEIAWFVYDLVHDPTQNRYQQQLSRTVYTRFQSALDRITRADAGSIDIFKQTLQARLAQHIPNTVTLSPDVPLEDVVTDEGGDEE